MKTLTTLFLLLFTLAAYSQTTRPTQTVRGTILDAASRTPVVGAAVRVVDSEPLIGTVTDTDGRFRLTNVPVGRIKLKITSVGYEDLALNEVIVNAGKEVVLDLPLTESVSSLSEVNVSYKRAEDRTVATNEMATVSARPFNAADAARFAGSFGDPSRMAANFAGVSGANDARNDIIVRGNSPASLLWRLEGVNIPNPNHFGSLGTSGGPVSLLNNNLLAKSDFLTGAFPAEYANALGSVFDVRLRKGNDEKREFLGQLGFNGLEAGAEGPYSKKSKASYLINYRYSFLGLMKNIGFEIVGVPQYQDFTFKTDIPVGKRGHLSAWTLAGRSNATFLGKDVDTEKPDAYGDENTNTRVKYSTGIAALSYEHRFSDRTYGKLTFSGSQSTQLFEGDTILYKNDKVIDREIRAEKADFTQRKLSLNAFLSHKISAKDKVSGGVITDLIQYDLSNQEYYPAARSLRNSQGETMLTQVYGQWKHRFDERLTLNGGLTFQYLELNGSTALEPRAGLTYQLSPGSSLNVAYGLHSMMQPILTYFYQSPQPDGRYALTNRDLGFMRSHHAVVGYDRMLRENLRLKVEAYHQWIFDAPVERTPSYFSLLTEGSDFAPVDKGNLINAGTGRNYGLEVTLEKYFADNYYFLVTTSLFESKYKGSDGIERNTPFNNRFVANVLAGREFRVGKRGNVFSINWKLTTAGGRYVTPINFNRSAEVGREIRDYNRAFTDQQTAYFRTDIKIGYKINRARLTHELALDLQNLTNNQNIFQQAYNPRTNRIGTAYQQGFLPIPFYRLTF
ncbi:TonB-dependent receptor [Larkinella soli]|uniref:TonB-dependent receptor n=1 Tax=Larkinella soli TaxID=1770527 RepID=UPI000FFC2DB5|nr:TonB-dependent receptor [Larkinella soli]